MTVINCPVCGAEEKFKPRQIAVCATNWGNLLELYIQCTHCPFRKIIRHTTGGLERVSDQIIRAKAEAVRQRKAFGSISPIMERILEKLKDELKYEQELLELMLDEFRKETN